MAQNPYPESLKELDQQIVRYRRDLQEAMRQQQMIQAKVEAGLKDEDAFDFLTNVGIIQPIEDDKQMTEIQETNSDHEEEIQSSNEEKYILNEKNFSKQNDVQRAFSEVYQHYQKEISKQFLKKETYPRKKRPKFPKVKLYITAQTNSVAKTGMPIDKAEHQMRVYNREHNPCQLYPIVPSFEPKKDNLANNVLAYLKDYKPLASGNKDLFPKCIKNLLQVELEMLKVMQQEENQTDRDTQQTIQHQNHTPTISSKETPRKHENHKTLYNSPKMEDNQNNEIQIINNENDKVQ